MEKKNPWVTFGWYVAGNAATVIGAVVMIALIEAVPALRILSAWVVAPAVVGGVLWSQRLSGRDRVAWCLGIVTPIALAVIAVGLLILAWANADITF